MASALFAAAASGHRAAEVDVGSAGVDASGLLAGRTVPEEVLEVMSPFGIDLRSHRSTGLSAMEVERADLVVGMGRRHVQEAVLLDPSAWPRSFSLRELVRRGEQVGRRGPDEAVADWLAAVHGGRTRRELVDRSKADDIEDPIGRSRDRYRATASELAGLTSRLAGLLWPGEAGPRPVGG